MATIRPEFYRPGTGIVLVFNFYEPNTEAATANRMDVSGAASYNIYAKHENDTEKTLTGAADDTNNWQVVYTVEADAFDADGEWTLHAEPVGLGGVTEASSPVQRLYVKSRHQD